MELELFVSEEPHGQLWCFFLLNQGSSCVRRAREGAMASSCVLLSTKIVHILCLYYQVVRVNVCAQILYRRTHATARVAFFWPTVTNQLSCSSLKPRGYLFRTHSARERWTDCARMPSKSCFGWNFDACYNVEVALTYRLNLFSE